MDMRALENILSWAKSTDLIELCFKHGEEGFDFRLEGAGTNNGPFSVSQICPVASSGVGVFRWNAPGAARQAEEGRAVKEGDLLGIIETGGKPATVVASASGKIAKIMVDDGSAVEYGQPLMLITP